MTGWGRPEARSPASLVSGEWWEHWPLTQLGAEAAVGPGPTHQPPSSLRPHHCRPALTRVSLGVTPSPQEEMTSALATMRVDYEQIKIKKIEDASNPLLLKRRKKARALETAALAH